MTSPFPIRTEADYQRAIALIDALWDAEPGSADADTLDIMATLVSVYEAASRNLPPADPLEIVRFKLRELGWSQREAGRRLGWGSGRVSEVLSGKRPLTMRMVQDLARCLELPAGVLVPDTRDEQPGAWVRLSPEVSQQTRAIAEEAGVSTSTVVQACLNVTLGSPRSADPVPRLTIAATRDAA